MPRRSWHLAEVPLLFPAIGMAAGIAAAMSSGLPVAIWFVIASVVVVIGVMLRRARIALTAISAIVGLSAGWLSNPVMLPPSASAAFRGVVVRADDFGTLQRLVVRTQTGDCVAVSVNDYPWLVEQGDSVAFSGMVLPAVYEPSVPDEYTGERYARVNYLSARCQPDEDGFEILSEADGLRGWLNDARRSLIDAIRHSGLSEPAADFLVAVLLGENEVDETVRSDFSHAGLSHVLALSGTHVSTIAMLIAMLLLPVEMAGGGRLRKLFTVVTLWAYAVLTGMSPSVVRAVIMASFLIAGQLSGRYSNSLNSLCGAAVVILLFDPAALFAPGFQLSFLAVAGIVMFVPPVMELLDWAGYGRRLWLRAVVVSVALPLAAVMATAPLSAWYFHSFPVWFLVANLPVAVLLPLILGGGAMLTSLSVCGFHWEFLSESMDSLCGWVTGVARFVAEIPGNGGDGQLFFPAWWLVPVYAGLFLLWLAWNTGRKSFLIDGLVMSVAAVALVPAFNRGNSGTECYPWRDGLSSNLVCRSGVRCVIVTDAAPKYYPGIRRRAEILLADYLGRRGVGLEKVTGDSLRMDGVDVTGNLWVMDGRRCVVVRSDADSVLTQVRDGDIILVTSGFKGDILELARRSNGCRIVLSPALPVQRRRRYAGELRGGGYHFSLDLADSWG